MTIIIIKKNHKTFFSLLLMRIYKNTFPSLPYTSWNPQCIDMSNLMDTQLTPHSCHQGRGKRTGFKVSPLWADITWLGVAENMGRIDSLRRGSGQWIFFPAHAPGWVVRRTVCKCKKSHGHNHRTLRFLLLQLYLLFDHFCSVLYTPPCLHLCSLSWLSLFGFLLCEVPREQ